MPKLPILSGKQLLKLLKKQNFLEIRRKGSHVFIEHQNKNLRTIIPTHDNEDLGKGLTKKILNDLEIAVEDLTKWLK